ncbi:hypothetical protein ILYODFUR_038729 [Ilyodon furcidens]|uniref:Uncharacterized protein n=1 Tax=Ilyodon furcidens TaxID=33524 RepID=A0ABV0UP49_9TELE
MLLGSCMRIVTDLLNNNESCFFLDRVDGFPGGLKGGEGLKLVEWSGSVLMQVCRRRERACYWVEEECSPTAEGKGVDESQAWMVQTGRREWLEISSPERVAALEGRRDHKKYGSPEPPPPRKTESYIMS